MASLWRLGVLCGAQGGRGEASWQRQVLRATFSRGRECGEDLFAGWWGLLSRESHHRPVGGSGPALHHSDNRRVSAPRCPPEHVSAPLRADTGIG